MSDAAIKAGSFRPKSIRLASGAALNPAGKAGPRRLMFASAALIVFICGVAYVVFSGKPPIPESRDARMKQVDPLPGGLQTTPEQDAMAKKANDRQAEVALKRGVSFTPQIAPSQPVLPAALQVERAAPLPAVLANASPAVARAQPHAVAPPAPHPVLRPTPANFTSPVELAGAAVVRPHVVPVAATTSPAEQAAQQAAYNKAVGDLFSQWGGRVPRTDVVLPPTERDPSGTGTTNDTSPAPAAPATSNRLPARVSNSVVPVSAQDTGRILVPAGRGIYAHPVLAANSDAASPIVLQADSGALASDRMMGTFSKQEDRLVIHVNTVEHHGESIGVDGVVIAPDTMEAAVASDVDQHYVARFLLPAAAAFVAGLGQAIAQTSNTTAVLSPLGGATTSTNLNIRQQLGVAAGSAAAQIGSTLAQQTPKGPTVSLEPNVAIGVMFLSNVTAHSGS